jgi:hypothetical protein
MEQGVAFEVRFCSPGVGAEWTMMILRGALFRIPQISSRGDAALALSFLEMTCSSPPM